MSLSLGSLLNGFPRHPSQREPPITATGRMADPAFTALRPGFSLNISYRGSTLEAKRCFDLNALLAKSAASDPFWSQGGYKLQINK